MLFKSIFKTILAVTLIVSFYFVIKYAEDIRNFVSIGYNKKVAGAKTSLEEEIKQDTFTYLDKVKNEVMQVKISDIAKVISRVQKVNKDLDFVKLYVVREINEKLKN